MAATLVQRDILIKRYLRGTYDVEIKPIGSVIYTLTGVKAGSYKQNKMKVSYDSNSKEIVMDFSAFDEAERNEIMKLIMDPEYNSELFRCVAINAVLVDNSFKKDGVTVFYKSDENTLRVRTWVLDMIKVNNTDNNGGFISIDGYTYVSIGTYSFSAEPAPEGLSEKVFQEKNYIYLDINFANNENLGKAVLLRDIGVTFTPQYGVGVECFVIKDLQEMGAISYPDDKTLRILINTNGGMNGYTGYEVVLEDKLGVNVQAEAKFVIASVTANISSSMSTLSDVLLERGWPSYTGQSINLSYDTWHWVDGSQPLKSGIYKARIEVWDYKESAYLRDTIHYVDYEQACKAVDNVRYVIENAHHYLEADIKVLKPESAGGHETRVINFDPNNTDSNVAVSKKTAVSRIDVDSSSSGYSTVD